MIQSIHIENYALIEHLDIQLHPGFSVITGETGAGKSIILGAIELLRGSRADTRAIKQGAQRCVVEATFDVSGYRLESFFSDNELDFDGQECIIRRELTAAGKSRAFINDTPVSLKLLNEIGTQLVDIHSQHQNLLLNTQGFQQNVLDILAQNQERLTHYRQTFMAWRRTQEELQQLIETANKSKDEEDYLRFQYAQLEEANLAEGEQTELEEELQMLEHAEEIKQALQTAHSLLDSAAYDEASDVLQRLKSAMSALRSIEDKINAAQALGERLNSCYIEIKDIADELETRADSVEYNPQRLEQVNDRLNQIYSLEQKHHVNSVEELLQLTEDIKQQLGAIDSSEEQIEALQKQCEQLQKEAQQQAKSLSAQRQKAARLVEEQMLQSLQPLGMPNVRFQVEVEFAETSLTEHGGDHIRFLFSANKNGQLQNLAQVASGGEIARVMLSLKSLIASAVRMPSIIFDEIDTGVSGSIAEKMARMMQKMGQADRQVISITHLPQIAALGSAHYKVYKQDGEDATTTHIVELSSEQRVEELAHMLSGETLTAAAIENARTLLKVNR